MHPPLSHASVAYQNGALVLRLIASPPLRSLLDQFPANLFPLSFPLVGSDLHGLIGDGTDALLWRMQMSNIDFSMSTQQILQVLLDQGYQIICSSFQRPPAFIPTVGEIALGARPMLHGSAVEFLVKGPRYPPTQVVMEVTGADGPSKAPRMVKFRRLVSPHTMRALSPEQITMVQQGFPSPIPPPCPEVHGPSYAAATGHAASKTYQAQPPFPAPPFATGGGVSPHHIPDDSAATTVTCGVAGSSHGSVAAGGTTAPRAPSGSGPGAPGGGGVDGLRVPHGSGQAGHGGGGLDGPRVSNGDGHRGQGGFGSGATTTGHTHGSVDGGPSGRGNGGDDSARGPSCGSAVGEAHGTGAMVAEGLGVGPHLNLGGTTRVGGMGASRNGTGGAGGDVGPGIRANPSQAPSIASSGSGDPGKSRTEGSHGLAVKSTAAGAKDMGGPSGIGKCGVGGNRFGTGGHSTTNGRGAGRGVFHGVFRNVGTSPNISNSSGRPLAPGKIRTNGDTTGATVGGKGLGRGRDSLPSRPLPGVCGLVASHPIMQQPLGKGPSSTPISLSNPFSLLAELEDSLGEISTPSIDGMAVLGVPSGGVGHPQHAHENGLAETCVASVVALIFHAVLDRAQRDGVMHPEHAPAFEGAVVQENSNPITPPGVPLGGDGPLHQPPEYGPDEQLVALEVASIFYAVLERAQRDGVIPLDSVPEVEVPDVQEASHPIPPPGAQDTGLEDKLVASVVIMIFKAVLETSKRECGTPKEQARPLSRTRRAHGQHGQGTEPQKVIQDPLVSTKPSKRHRSSDALDVPTAFVACGATSPDGLAANGVVIAAFVAEEALVCKEHAHPEPIGTAVRVDGDADIGDTTSAALDLTDADTDANAPPSGGDSGGRGGLVRCRFTLCDSDDEATLLLHQSRRTESNSSPHAPSSLPTPPVPSPPPSLHSPFSFPPLPSTQGYVPKSTTSSFSAPAWGSGPYLRELLRRISINQDLDAQVCLSLQILGVLTKAISQDFCHDSATRCNAFKALQQGIAPTYRGSFIASMVLSANIFLVAADVHPPLPLSSWQAAMEVLLDEHPDEGNRPTPDLQYLVPEVLTKMRRLADRVSSTISSFPALQDASLQANTAHHDGHP